MDRKTYAIGILSLMATVMATALLVTPTSAGPVGSVVRDRDYTMVTASVQTGGDALYIMDNRRGLVAVLTYDNATRGMRLRAAEPIRNALAVQPGGNNGGAAPNR